MLRTENLTVRYGRTLALRDVSLEAEAGRITAVVGPSGCGKSTLLAALTRMLDLVPGAAAEGRIWVDGAEIHDARQRLPELRKSVGTIFQKPNPFPMSIRRNVELALREHGVRERRRLEAMTRRALVDVGLWDEVRERLDAPALDLSGGQQQRLCIARALALEPSVLLLDEPCSALDPIAAGVVEGLIARLRGALTIVVVTHNLAQARRLADRVAVLWVDEDGAGRLIESGSVEQIFEAPRHPLTRAYVRGAAG